MSHWGISRCFIQPSCTTNNNMAMKVNEAIFVFYCLITFTKLNPQKIYIYLTSNHDFKGLNEFGLNTTIKNQRYDNMPNSKKT